MTSQRRVEKVRIALRIASAFGKRVGAARTPDEMVVREVAATVAGVAAVLAYRLVKARGTRLVR